jgi:hypothetical protein
MNDKKHPADELLFEKEEKPVFRSMIVPDKVLDNDNISEDKV